MPSFTFHFYQKDGKRNTAHFLFFVFMEKFKKELFKKIRIELDGYFHKYGLQVIQEQIRVP